MNRHGEIVTTGPVSIETCVEADGAAARHFHGRVPGLPVGRSTDHRMDWDPEEHQMVTHLVPSAPLPAGTGVVGKHTDRRALLPTVLYPRESLVGLGQVHLWMACPLVGGCR
ncbi:hypothetical protein ABZ770_22625 [Streptomyces sp. NPDC006654]|uniref:hypothetical protein n=1 Tax=Streptomyces sp. NPDC006654 TaxID=3156897 RepID=UPI0033D62E0F